MFVRIWFDLQLNKKVRTSSRHRGGGEGGQHTILPNFPKIALNPPMCWGHRITISSGSWRGGMPVCIALSCHWLHEVMPHVIAKLLTKQRPHTREQGSREDVARNVYFCTDLNGLLNLKCIEVYDILVTVSVTAPDLYLNQAFLITRI